MNNYFEDTINCIFYSTIDRSLKQWHILCNDINNTAQNLSSGYIWHKDEFKVNYPVSEIRIDIPHLFSSTCFGDNIEDEWFIVHLVYEISKKFRDLIIQLSDSDGEFLLIEAANFLPSWLNPETAVNRVFICNNSLHIIPQDLVHADEEITANEAIKLVIQSPVQTRAPDCIQQSIQKRIQNITYNLNSNFHTCSVNLPVEIAALLSIQPALIAPIVTAYCNHDMIDTKECKDMKFENCVLSKVKFTKCLYAMLMHSPVMNSSHCKFDLKQKSNCIGYKLKCGFQIIMNNSSRQNNSNELNQFLKELTKKGYFKNNLEGSQEYKLLLEQAKEYFKTGNSVTNHVNNINTCLKSTELQEIKKRLLECNQNTEESDESDDWLNIKSDHLNTLLNDRYDQDVKFDKNNLTPNDLTTKINEFLKEDSNFEGIEHIKNDTEENKNFNSNDFVESIEKMLNLISTGVNVNSEESELSDSDFEENIETSDMVTKNMLGELKEKLKDLPENAYDNKNVIISNLKQSVKEEGCAPGPSSTMLMSAGFSKKDLLDSDDE